MCRAQCVLAVVALYVGVAHSWDLAVSSGDQLIFYDNNGTEINRVKFMYQNLGGLAYDVVHNRMLYVDKQNNNDAIFGYNLSSKENECLIERSGRNIRSIAYDPATEKLFFTDAYERSINWISLKRGSNNNINGNLLIKMNDRTPDDIAVDSCGGYIYWSKTEHMKNIDIERARFDGSGREALYDKYHAIDAISLTIDPQKQKIYYIDKGSTVHLNSADMDRTNEHHYDQINVIVAKELTVSKDNLYFMTITSGESYKRVWRFPKNGRKFAYHAKEISKFYTDGFLGIAANYKIEDQINGIQNCDSLSNLTTNTEAPGNTSEQFDVCVNYCLHGNCSVSDEGLPLCSCNAGYLGERCEVSACNGYCLNDGKCSLNEDSVAVCQCKGDYSGDRCHVNDCLNYCFQGNCSLSDEGHPTCSCNAGYSGERCEVSSCHGYCLNDGQCSLNEEDDPVCQCAGNHEGARCEADVTNTTATYELSNRNLTLADLQTICQKPSSRILLLVEVP